MKVLPKLGETPRSRIQSADLQLTAKVSAQLTIATWGKRGGGLTWQRSVDEGARVGAELIEIRASVGCDGGVWFRIRKGVRGLLVGREAYLIVEPATYYYHVMTRQDRMPALIGERI